MIGHKVLRETAAVLFVAALGVGCGATPPAPADSEWIANARGVVNQLRSDVVAVAGFDRAREARIGLRDESQLYTLLVSYTDFGGCGHMVAAVGAEPPGLAPAVGLMRRACLHLRRADRLFTRAVAGSNPQLLTVATRQAVAALPLLDAVALRLARHS
jgi:hypothetical protein